MLLLKMPFLSSIHNLACSRHCISIHHSITPTPSIPYDWSILTLDVNHVNSDFKIQRNDSNERVKEKKQNQKSNRFNEQTTTLHVHHTFLCISLPFSRFMRMSASNNEIFFLYVSGLGYGPLEFNSRNNRDKDWKNENSLFIISDVLVAVTSLDKEKNKASA